MDAELIERLANAARVKADSYGEMDSIDLPRFAALIAEECAKVCVGYRWRDDPFDPDRDPTESNRGCADAIRAKFALKE